MTEFITRNYGNENFEIIIKTDSKEHYKATEDFARRLIDHAKPSPTIEAKPVVHAHWKDIGLETKHRFCTKCGGCVTQRESWVYKYCPHCGAQMDEVVK